MDKIIYSLTIKSLYFFSKIAKPIPQEVKWSAKNYKDKKHSKLKVFVLGVIVSTHPVLLSPLKTWTGLDLPHYRYGSASSVPGLTAASLLPQQLLMSFYHQGFSVHQMCT